MSLLAELLKSSTQHPTPAKAANAANPSPQPAPEPLPISTISRISKGADTNGGFCERWAEVATLAGCDPGPIVTMPEAELELYRQHFEGCTDPYRAMQAAAEMLADSARMGRGEVPLGWTAAAICQHCGPVLLHPDQVKLLDVKDGHPWCMGCPWCHVTMPLGHRLPRPTV